ncbi:MULTISPECIES: efflux RND transporter periplasmic adaptor subunit [unclassified Agarivorans]|uniref:efflux RND transporter periplasmic adaptor subunit n=1 Tax=unclassified Agarivorans TaxID=2636026 RepID=UPI003D7EBC57
MKKIITLLLIVALLIFTAWWLRSKPLSVVLVRVEVGDVIETVVNTRAGTINSCQRARLALSVGGVIAELHVREGDRVKRGEPLLALWDQDLQAQQEQAQARVTLAQQHAQLACLQARFEQRESRRLQPLQKHALTSETSIDRADTLAATSALNCEASETELLIARAQLKLAEAQLQQTHLFAPFSGIVAEVNGELGEYLTPSPPGVATLPAIDLIDVSCLYVSAPIDEVDAAKLRVGQAVNVLLDALPKQVFPARLSRIAPYVLDLEKQARTVEVEVELGALPSDIQLLIGYSADLEIEIQRREQVLRIPTEAITAEGVVYLFENNSLKPLKPELGLSNWSWQEIFSGLHEGQQIVRQAARVEYQPGMQVSGDD